MVVTMVAVLAGGAALVNGTLKAISPSESPDRLVLRSKSSFSLQELAVDLGHEDSRVELRVCESLDRFGSCKTVWKISQRLLSKEENKSLALIARRAELFNGRSNGAQMDFAYRSLEVQARKYSIAILITSLNDSFTEKGPRRDLLARLMALEAELTPSLVPATRGTAAPVGAFLR